MSDEVAAFVGLGSMGWWMASHLSKRYSRVLVWNRTTSKAKKHAAEFGTHACEELADLSPATVVFLCLPTSTEVLQTAHVLRAALRPESVLVDCA
jgi:3-hydroxyisobutyrate dehydrogenase